MPECGHLMGHLAVPNKDGVLSYLPIRCNSPEGHELNCEFIDPRSGLEVLWVRGRTMSVDERGCVVTP